MPTSFYEQVTGRPVTPTSYQYQAPSINYGAGASGLPPASGMDLSSLTAYMNQLNRSGQTAANAARIPNATPLETQSSTVIGQELQGELPADVIRQMQQQAAERGVATGTPGSANNNAAYLRALGLTSLQEQQTGEANLSAALARNPAAPLYDPATQLLTPYQTSELGLQQGSLDLARQSEADRVALEQQQLAASALRGGGGGGGGGTRTGATGNPTGTQTWYDPAQVVGGPLGWNAPYNPPTDPMAAWWQATTGGLPGTPAVSGTGNTTIDGQVIPSTASANASDWLSNFGSDLIYGGQGTGDQTAGG